jgi:hypothetical protein
LATKHCGGISLEQALTYNSKKVQKTVLEVNTNHDKTEALDEEEKAGRGEGLLDYV